MSRPKECVVAVYEEIDDARTAIKKMDLAGFPTKLMSLVSAHLRPAKAASEGAGHCYRTLPAECPPTCHGQASCAWSEACVPKILQFGDSMEKNAAVGAVTGGFVGLLAGASVLPFASGQDTVLMVPIAATSAVVGGLLGAMFGWGVHSNRLVWYEQKLKSGKTLLMIHGDPLEVAQASRVLKKDTAPASLHMYAKTSADEHAIHGK
ncbi:MAG: hypothetical protein QF408_13315 [Pirellulales bacterium]|jgi:hypothetical protein|nr:hypothetical protein [Pirellulales bacterium]|tara:strand:+ start:248 stop:868 length:621 start_codon:yes stop_codon:yes gene_type:complete